MRKEESFHCKPCRFIVYSNDMGWIIEGVQFWKGTESYESIF